MFDISNNLDIKLANQEKDIINFLKEHDWDIENKSLFLKPEEKFKPKRLNTENPGIIRNKMRERRDEERKYGEKF